MLLGPPAAFAAAFCRRALRKTAAGPSCSWCNSERTLFRQRINARTLAVSMYTVSGRSCAFSFHIHLIHHSLSLHLIHFCPRGAGGCSCMWTRTCVCDPWGVFVWCAYMFLKPTCFCLLVSSCVGMACSISEIWCLHSHPCTTTPTHTGMDHIYTHPNTHKGVL